MDIHNILSTQYKTDAYWRNIYQELTDIPRDLAESILPNPITIRYVLVLAEISGHERTLAGFSGNIWNT